MSEIKNICKLCSIEFAIKDNDICSKCKRKEKIKLENAGVKKIKLAKKIAVENKNKFKLESSRLKLIVKTINEDVKSNLENEKVLMELKKSCVVSLEDFLKKTEDIVMSDGISKVNINKDGR